MRTGELTLGPRILFVSDETEEVELTVNLILFEPETELDEDGLNYTYEGAAEIKCAWFETRVRALAEDDLQLIARLVWLAGVAIDQTCKDMQLRCRSFVQQALGEYGEAAEDLFR